MTREDAALRAIEALPHAMLVMDGAERLVLANAALWGEAGADPARFPPGTSLRDILRLFAFRGLLGAGDPAVLAEDALALDRSQFLLRHQRTADGARLSEVTSLPLPGGGFAICSVDITALTRAEAAARARASLLERVLNAQRGGVALFDPDHRLMLHNPAYRRHSGATPEMLAGRPTLEDLVAQLDRAGEFRATRARAHLRDILAADRRQPRMSQRERADGSIMRFTSTPEPDGGFLLQSEEVTDLRRAEDDARRRAAILDGVLEALPHGICVWGPDQRVALFNGAYTRLMEGAPLQVGDTLEDVIHRRAAAGEYGPGDVSAVIAREKARDLSRPQERRRQRANGTALDIRTAPLPDGGHISVVTDITALWQAEEEARRRASLLETAMGSMRHGLVVYGPDRRVVAANALASTLAGHEPGDIRPGRSLDELVDSLHASGRLGPEPLAARLAGDARDLDRSRPHRVRRTTPEGRVLEVSSDPTPEGGFIVTHVDITALAQAEAEALSRAGILQVMLDNTQHGICLFDAQGHIVAVNALAARMCGLAPEQMAPGRHILQVRDDQVAAGEFGPPEQVARFIAIRPDDPWRGPERYVRRRPDGSMLEITTAPTPDGGFVRTYSDVTEDRRVRDELERARAAAEAGSEAKSRFLATMSHELRTPLSAVIGYAEALMGQPAPAQVAEFADAVRQAGRQLLGLIDDILDVARAGGPDAALGRAPVDVAALALALAEAAQAEADAAGVQLAVDAPPELPAARVDERRLRRVLSALLGNAVKFTPAEGSVRLVLRASGAGGLDIAVVDTGIGMAPEDIPRAFEPFTQLDSSHARHFPGSGLGLHLARMLAEAMGATLTLDSSPGAGTTATLRLPPGITTSVVQTTQETT
ncbi:PAS domain-containing sensor histidine kinase [Roseomonas fluvialis]|uniref:histidine kinase n=1 Tax=Roseomonas fluvialis TaxID=1750527 RepID=A0ABN6P7P8_9PROT|nr:PAS domain-containing sensor histidine kinase [Roseomonas fluvialis]BDG73774.1 PAS domain-containing sensor histidine kinase [Roseomonas fluvialis]